MAVCPRLSTTLIEKRHTTRYLEWLGYTNKRNVQNTHSADSGQVTNGVDPITIGIGQLQQPANAYLSTLTSTADGTLACHLDAVDGHTRAQEDRPFPHS